MLPRSYANGDGCGSANGAPRAVTYYFACDPSAATPQLTISPGAAVCQYRVVVTTRDACPAPAPPVPCISGAYDLTALQTAGALLSIDAEGTYTYVAAVCGVVNDNGGPCSAAGGSACQYQGNGYPLQFAAALGTWTNSSAVWTPCTDPTDCPHGGVDIALANGQLCNGAPRQVLYRVACASGSAALTYSVTALSPCHHKLVFAHQSGCPVGDGDGDDESVDTNAGVRQSVRVNDA